MLRLIGIEMRPHKLLSSYKLGWRTPKWRNKYPNCCLVLQTPLKKFSGYCFSPGESWCSRGAGSVLEGGNALELWVMWQETGFDYTVQVNIASPNRALSQDSSFISCGFFFFFMTVYFLSDICVFLWAMWNIKCFMKCLAHASLWFWFWKPRF